MPLYEYVCDTCQAVVEVIRPVEDRNDEMLCEKCLVEMRKVINAPNAIIFPFQMHGISSSGRKIPGRFGE